MRALILVWGVVVALGAGCARLRLQLVDGSVRKPSNVAVYFTVYTKAGEPVATLTPQDFHIYEDHQPVSILESKQTMLQPEVAAIHYTLLLVDMSGSVVDSGEMPVGFGGGVGAAIKTLAGRRPRDPSTNLNGGVIEAVRILTQQMASSVR